MADLGAASALALAVVFGWAAVVKVRERTTTIASFRGLGLPGPAVLATVVPLVEGALAGGLVVAPAPAAFAVLVMVLAFSVVIGRAIAAGATVSCACFGGGGGDRPVSGLELVRNGGLAALAVVASGAGAGPVRWPSLSAIVVVIALLAVGRAGLAVAARRRIGDHRFSRSERVAAPPAPESTTDGTR